MTESVQASYGSLQARIIRACKVHTECELECANRQVVELGEVASFGKPNAGRSLTGDLVDVLNRVRNHSPGGGS